MITVVAIILGDAFPFWIVPSLGIVFIVGTGGPFNIYIPDIPDINHLYPFNVSPIFLILILSPISPILTLSFPFWIVPSLGIVFIVGTGNPPPSIQYISPILTLSIRSIYILESC